MSDRNSLISALRHSLYRTHDKSKYCSGCAHAEDVLVEADRGPSVGVLDYDTLIRLEDFLDDYSDVKDGQDGPVPNRAMSLLQDVRKALDEGGTGECSTVVRAVRQPSETPRPGPDLGREGAGVQAGAGHIEPGHSPVAPLVIRCAPATYSPAAVIRPGPAHTVLPEPAAGQHDGSGAPACAECGLTERALIHSTPDPWLEGSEDCHSFVMTLPAEPAPAATNDDGGGAPDPWTDADEALYPNGRPAEGALEILAKALGCETPEQVDARLHSEEAAGMDAREFLSKRGGVE